MMATFLGLTAMTWVVDAYYSIQHDVEADQQTF